MEDIGMSPDYRRPDPPEPRAFGEFEAKLTVTVGFYEQEWFIDDVPNLKQNLEDALNAILGNGQVTNGIEAEVTDSLIEVEEL